MRLFWLIAFCLPVSAQPGWKKETFPSSGDVYVEDGRKSAGTGFFRWETTAPVRGLLFLFPGLGLSDLEGETHIARQMAVRGIVTVVPRINNRLFWDTAAEKAMAETMTRVWETLPDSILVFAGGFSAGGHLALTFAESRLEAGKPLSAVFAIDPPTDLAAFYRMGQRRMAMKSCRLLVREGKSMTQNLENALGGSPETATGEYRLRSAFFSPDGGRAKRLIHTAVRVYAEPDTAFWQKEFCPAISYEDLNAASAGRMVDFLRKEGNTQARFIVTQGKGYLRGRRFPHAWSVADPEELADWLAGLLP